MFYLCRRDVLQFNFKESLDLDSKNTWTTLLASDWFYDILELFVKRTQTTFLDLDWYYILDLYLKSDWINLVE